MYSAEQIRNKAYIPDSTYRLLNEEDVVQLVLVADVSGKHCIRIREEVIYEAVPQTLKFSGYNVEPVEFLGTKFWQISW